MVSLFKQIIIYTSPFVSDKTSGVSPFAAALNHRHLRLLMDSVSNGGWSHAKSLTEDLCVAQVLYADLN